MMKNSGWRWLALCLMLILAVGCTRRGGLQIDDPAPVVSLPDFHGKTVNLPQDLKGKVLLVRFWSLDCVYCNKEMLPALEALYQKYKDKGFVPVAIDVGQYDGKDERWKRFEQLTYPMLNDERGLVARRFGVIGMPTSFVIDREGILRGKITGEAGLDEFEKLFTTVLN
ncbi:peroxiredoxin family protein [Methylomonas rapida]|jgi:Peroxiredoxin|uniref:TlpA disulfide reductase family protein n=1 Tax=Methylomonas rapida TaxID=2963939 RepID=A0ABY7GMB9_9GAMM|nr:TlpA disulfide reductase family protein [Methylomonas rapida]WAR45641.1 TlpA disulfide reductase family protein [Methylomonas rapida]